MKIDLVYTWVDNNDPVWRGEKTFWSKIYKNEKSFKNNICRFCNNDELKYSLRSAQMNAPWINHIFIITAGQIPSWLDVSHPKITIVNHNEILPQEALPTYNSLAIETGLHNIPNLSEHFLYANDDMFFLNPVDANYFFDHNQNPYVRFCRMEVTEEMIKKQSYYSQIRYSFYVYNEKFPLPEFFKNYLICHNVDPYRKSYLKECKENFAEEFYKTALTKFRLRDTLIRVIYGFFMADQKSCVIREVVNTKEAFSLKQPELLNVNISSLSFAINNNYISNGFPKLLCINDGEKVKEEERKIVPQILENFFPQKAEWEIG